MTTGDCFILMRFEERRTNDPLFDKRRKGGENGINLS